jgi:tryptophanase
VKSVQLTPATPDYARIIAEYGYNVVNIHPSLVERDLMTDSWTDLLSPVMDARLAALHARLDYADRQVHAADIFPFRHFLPVAQGRAAEAFFWRAAARKDKCVVQNLLFPTSRHHLVLNRMRPVELPAPDVLQPGGASLFRGNLDCARLRDLLSEAQHNIGFIYVEAENNASGGYPVSMANVRELRQLAREHGIEMVLDATRIIENAVLIQAHEPGFENTPLKEIVRAFCAHFDAMTCSLAKDFGLARGGFIATNDDKLYCRALDYAATFGPGINATDKALINAAMQDWEFIETQVKIRVAQTARLHTAFAERRLPLLQPASGHCLVIEVGDYIDLQAYRNPVVALLAWLFAETGIRGGLHGTGMGRDYARNSMIRFAVPLCTPDRLIDELQQPFVDALCAVPAIPDMEKISTMPGITGQIRASYRPVSLDS